jgi:hypothetical protein
MKTSLKIVPVLLFAAMPLRAQLVAEGATNMLSTNGSFTLLVPSNNALVTNSANGVIGLNLTATSNVNNGGWLARSDGSVGIRTP